ncbi:MAG: tyrosine-type recombinase/integrase [Clostridia bacterium]|nr:tyrosine-type recombinase/integrase [Clostridia bacterium]
MAENRQSFKEQTDAKRILQIRAVLKELPQACSDFLRSVAISTGTFTRLAYAIDLRTFFNFLHDERIAFSDKDVILYDDADLEKLTRNDITAYTEYLTYYLKSADDDSVPNKEYVNHELSIKRKLCAIRSFYDYLFTNQRISSNVTELVPLPKIHEKPIIRLNKEEMDRILSTAQTGDSMTKSQQKYQKITAKRDYAMLSLFLGTGIRVSECVGIDIDDLDMENNAFLVTRKGGNQVVLYFPPEVADALGEYLEERQKIEPLPGHENALFLSLQRKRITQRAVQNLVKKYAAIAAPLKQKISPHKLRSTYATNLYQETSDIYLVADVLGHTSVDTTRKHYADMTDARRRMAAEHVHLPGDPQFRKDDN